VLTHVAGRGAALLAAITLAAVHAHAQAPLIRLEAASLSPEDPTNVTMAYGGTVGVSIAARDALLVRFLLQSQNRNSGADLGAAARHFYLLTWEHAFNDETGTHRQQYLLRTGLGAVERSPWRTAPAVSAGLAVRYGLGRHFGFVGAIEDVMAALPEDSLTACDPVYGCSLLVSKRELQHNFGLAIAAELRLR